jgi:hypothetical protein
MRDMEIRSREHKRREERWCTEAVMRFASGLDIYFLQLVDITTDKLCDFAIKIFFFVTRFLVIKCCRVVACLLLRQPSFFLLPLFLERRRKAPASLPALM